MTFFSHLHQNGCPPGWMPGAVAPFAPPLHAAGATQSRVSLGVYHRCYIKSSS